MRHDDTWGDLRDDVDDELAHSSVGKKSNTTLIAAVCAISVAAVLGIAVLVAVLNEPEPPAPIPDDLVQKKRDTIKAFDGEPVLEDHDELPHINEFFDRMKRVLDDGQAEGFREIYDLERMVDVVAESCPKLRNSGFRRDFMSDFRVAAIDGFAKSSAIERFDAFEVRKVTFHREKSEAVVFMRTFSGGVEVRMRYWLIKHADGWKVYDREELNIGMRMTDGVIAAAQRLFQPGANVAEFSRQIELYGQFMRAFTAEDADTADRVYRQMRVNELPTRLRAVVFTLRATLFASEAESENALEFADKALELNRDLPLAHMARGLALLQLERYEESAAACSAYAEIVGVDNVVAWAHAEALLELQRHAEGLEIVRKGLSAVPDDTDLLYLAMEFLTELKRPDEFLEFFVKVVDKPTVFKGLCTSAVQFDSIEKLGVFLKAMRIAAKQDAKLLEFPEFHYFNAYEHFGHSRNLAAVESLKPRLKLAEPERRAEFVSLYASALADSGQPLKAYEEFRGNSGVFALIAPEQLEQIHVLTELIALHRAAKPNDPQIVRFQAEVDLWYGRWESAERALKTAIAQSTDETERESLEESLSRALVNQGKVQEAYERLGATSEGFATLQRLLPESHYQTLIDSHRAAHPNAPELVDATIQLLIANKDFEQAAKHTLQVWQAETDADRKANLKDDYLMVMVELGRFFEGVTALKDDPDECLEMLYYLMGDEQPEQVRELCRTRLKQQPDSLNAKLVLADLLTDPDQRIAGLLDLNKIAPDGPLRTKVRDLLLTALASRGRVEEAYRLITHPNPEEVVRVCWIASRDNSNADQLRHVLKSWLADDPDADSHKDFPYYRAFAAFTEKRFDEAAAILRPKQASEPSTRESRLYIRSVYFGQGASAAFKNELDRASVASILFDEIVGSRAETDFESLDTLLAAIKKSAPELHDDYAGQVALMKQDWPTAIEHFQHAIQHAQVRYDRETNQDRLSRARFHARQWKQAYSELRPKGRVFGELARLAIQAEDFTTLHELVELHRPIAAPEELVRFEMQLATSKQDWNAVVKLAKQPHAAHFQRWLTEALHFDALLMLARFDEAEPMVGNDGFRRTKLIIVRWKDDPPAALKHLNEQRHPQVAALYDDSIVGPILRSDPFKAIRERFPPST